MDLILVHPPHLIGLACVYVASVLKEKDNTSWFEDLRADMNVVRHLFYLIFKKSNESNGWKFPKGESNAYSLLKPLYCSKS